MGKLNAETPQLSIVVVAYDMARELPRSIRSLDPRHQVGVDADDYEVIVVDNGSARPVGSDLTDRFAGNIRVERLDPAPPSPARAANLGIEMASGRLIGLIVDGARISSPGLVRAALLAERTSSIPVITASAWHLGSVPHMRAAEVGYDQAEEDALLATSGWEDDGYSLFEISTFAGSSWRGIFGPMGESSSLFMHRGEWVELGGLDERFDLPGGGLVNHDLYRRACSMPGAELVHLLGEGTFHQFHGGAATSRRYGWEEMHDGYVALRGEDYRPPSNRPLYVGSVPPQMLGHLEASARLALDNARSKKSR